MTELSPRRGLAGLDGGPPLTVPPPLGAQADLLAGAARTAESRVQRFSLPAQLPTLAQRRKPAAPAGAAAGATAGKTPPTGAPAGRSLTINSPAGAPVGAAPSTAKERYDSL